MATFDTLRAARSVGRVYGGIAEGAFPTAAAVAQHFGLDADAEVVGEVSREQAQELLERVLQSDLAYGAKILSKKLSEELASAFLAEVEPESAKYFSNVTTYLAEQTGLSPDAWRPATDGTFDSGVLVVGTTRSACFWVEDED
jgi:hypothetical protein